MGVCKKPMNRGGNVGERLAFYDYTAKKILSIKQYELKVREEIQKIKRLTRANAKKNGWIVRAHQSGVLYLNDPVDRLKGIASQRAKKLVK